MSIIPGFLADIRDDLDDDAPRLICADYLDDQADPRGEYLRTQCQLAQWVPDLARRTEMQQRLHRLERDHFTDWVQPLNEYCETIELHRGMMHVSIPASKFFSAPFVRSCGEKFSEGWIAHARLLGLKGQKKSFENSLLEDVASLDVSRQALYDTTFIRLLDEGDLSRLTHLDVSNNELTDRSLLHLQSWKGLDRLLFLDLRNNSFKNRAMQNFLRAVQQSKLRRLELHGNDLSDTSVDAYVEWCQHRPPTPGARPRPINSLGMQFVEIPSGTYMMGAASSDRKKRSDETPLHEVTITQPFFFGMFPVTQRQYERVQHENPAFFNSRRRRGGPDHPVEHVDYNDALAFCEKLSNLPEERRSGRSYRLPTEAEWEHACRAGTRTPFFYGKLPRSTEFNYDGNHVYGGTRRGPYLERTSIVGAYPPNPFGLYDIHGNVWEWCQDYHSKTYYKRSPKKDPRGPKRGTNRVIRGGCWDCIGAYCRSSHRHGDPPETRDDYNGFRVVMEVEG